MKKQTKVLVTLSAAALLAVGFSAVSFAEGWDNSTGSWQYLDKDGEPVTDTWKTSNGQKFWLGDDGNMVTDSLIKDDDGKETKYYYVDSNGAMVSNTWKAVALDDDENTDQDAEYWWYYFGSDGKAYTTSGDKVLTKSKMKTINGLKYGFDDEGHMLYGWIDADDLSQKDDDDTAWKDADFYFSGWNDGHAATGWQQLTVTKDDGDEATYWFHFKDWGKKEKGRKKINGKYYHLDDVDGHMIDEWDLTTRSTRSTDNKIYVGADFTATANTARINYLNGDGSERKNKWVYAIPDEDWINDDYEDDQYRWFYFNKSGKLTTDQVKKINGKYYGFDQYGRMVTGFALVDNDNTLYKVLDDTDKYSRWTIMSKQWNDDLMYFNENEKTDGRRETGYQKIELDDGDYQFYFDTKNGRGKTQYNTQIKKFTVNGLVLAPTADDDNNVAAIAGVTHDDDGYHVDAANVDMTLSYDEIASTYDTTPAILVNKAGTIQKNKTKFKDEDDHYYATDANGYVTGCWVDKDAYDAAH